ncbi:unnamed protein product [Jaminaea pallidilutea]
MAAHDRDPCPYVIINDFGGAFAMGTIGGAIFHSIKGAKNAPRGYRWPSSIAAVKARAPVLGGNFGVWGGLFSSYDCAIKGIRQKEDAWNAITAGFLTGGSLAIRSGPKTALGSGIMCGILLGCFEGVGALVQRFMAEGNKQVAPVIPEGTATNASAPTSLPAAPA